jgi:hypothetical protein
VRLWVRLFSLYSARRSWSFFCLFLAPGLFHPSPGLRFLLTSAPALSDFGLSDNGWDNWRSTMDGSWLLIVRPTDRPLNAIIFHGVDFHISSIHPDASYPSFRTGRCGPSSPLSSTNILSCSLIFSIYDAQSRFAKYLLLATVEI